VDVAVSFLFPGAAFVLPQMNFYSFSPRVSSSISPMLLRLPSLTNGASLYLVVAVAGDGELDFFSCCLSLTSFSFARTYVAYIMQLLGLE